MIIKLLDQFADKLTQIQLYQRAINLTAKNELERLNKNARTIEERPDYKELSVSERKEFLSSIDNMFFHSSRDGRLVPFGQRISSTEDRRNAIAIRKNKQYQWLLAEAYEEFEDFIESAYAFAVCIDAQKWPLKNVDDVSLSESNFVTFDWNLKRARNSNNISGSILSKFRNGFPEIATIEVRNALGINLKFFIFLIEKLRHIIVHKAGTVSDKSAFIKLVLESA